MQLAMEMFVDNFAGGGGASTGIELAIGRPVDVAINHDPDAVRMHKANHPHTKHYCESVWDVDPKEICKGRTVALAWFSPDCKHFSKAKGGKPVNKKIRGLAWVVLRWAALVRPRVIMLENVEEFQTWGPVRKGRPVKAKIGVTFQRWKAQLEALGYEMETRELRACDYGAPTTRKRFFVVARCDGQPIVWPKPTHGDPNRKTLAKKRLKPWRTAAEVIDFSLPCPSIFDTSEEIMQKYGLKAIRPLAENTMKRIARGIQRYVIENPAPFIVDFKFENESIDETSPLRTVTAVNGFGVVAPTLIEVGYGEALGQAPRAPGLHKPLGTVVGSGKHALVMPALIQYHTEKAHERQRGQDSRKPLHTIDAANRYGLVSAFLAKHYDGGYKGAGSDMHVPIPTVTAVDHHSLITANLVKFQENNPGCPVDEPMHTVMPGAQRFGMVTSHLMIHRHHSTGQGQEEPLHTMTASGQHFSEVRAFLVKYYGQGGGQSVEEPMHTATAQDRFGLVTVQGTEYAIVDIGLRMLTPRELYLANGFPADYIIAHDHEGKQITKAAQVARCGNAVPPPFAEALVRANLPEYCGKPIESMEQLRARIAN